MKTALVAGASGLAGRAIVDRLRRVGGFRILALSRNARDLFVDTDGVLPLDCDLLDEASVAAALKSYDVHYLFYTAVFTGKGGVPNFSPKSDATVRLTQAALSMAKPPARLAAFVMPNAFYSWIHRLAGSGETDKNFAMFKNALDACRGSSLEHVTLVTGGKYYGHHLGPRLYRQYKAPFEEDQPRPPGCNWYYAVEDYAAECQAQDGSWYYSTLRPSSIVGFATGSPYNMGTSLAVYASIRKHLGLPLLLPASPAVQTTDIEFSPADLIGDMAFWSICEPRCRNEAYNASFGARTSWKKIWPEIAGYFNMPVEYSTHAQCVGRITRDFPRIWSDMCRQSGVTFPNFDEVCKPAFMDQEFMVNWDAGYSPEKSRAHGYTKSIDPQSMFHRFFDRLVEQKVIPDPNYRKRLWQSPSIRALHSDQAKITR